MQFKRRKPTAPFIPDGSTQDCLPPPKWGVSPRSYLCLGSWCWSRPRTGPPAQQNVFTEEKDYRRGENGLSYATDHKVSHSLLQKVFPGHILTINHLIIFFPTQGLCFPTKGKARKCFHSSDHYHLGNWVRRVCSTASIPNNFPL